MHRHRAVTQHGFGPRGRDGNIIALLAQGDIPVLVLFDVFIGHGVAIFIGGQRVFEMPHMAGGFDVLDLQIRNGGFKMRIPIDQPFAAGDQPLVIHFDEDLQNGLVKIALGFGFGGAGRAGHGECVARPVAGGADAF